MGIFDNGCILGQELAEGFCNFGTNDVPEDVALESAAALQKSNYLEAKSLIY